MTATSNSLSDLVSPTVLQELQDGFTAVTGLQASIVDHQGHRVTETSDCSRLSEREAAIEHTINRDHPGSLTEPFSVPIDVDGRRLGAIVLTGRTLNRLCPPNDEEIRRLADRFGIRIDELDAFREAVDALGISRRAEVVRFVYLMADAIAQVCLQDLRLKQRVDEMTTLYQLSTLLAGKRELQEVLDTVTQQSAQVLNAKAASIRLLDEAGRELVPTAVYNLSQEYLDKGPILLERSAIDLQATRGEVVYIADMAHDPRVLYPADARREGLASIICAGMIYRGRTIGVMRIYTAEHREFTEEERQLLQAIAQLAAAAIENARLEAVREESRRVQRQVRLAADVQRRLIPAANPHLPPFDVAGRYEPCFELGGDFYDLIRFERTLGVAIGDVVGKGIAASLLMASVRAALRAHVEDVYDIDEIMAKVNTALAHDTRDHEFATAFYGTLDSDTLRLTYCSAGHDPAFLLRDGQFIDLDVGGMALGIDEHQHYDKGLIDLHPNDVLLIYTDGVPDAQNFAGEKFGRDRIRKAMTDVADKAAGAILNHVLWEVRRFIGLNNPPDDITLVVVKVDPARYAAGAGI